MNRVVRAQKLKLALVAESGLSLGDIFPLMEDRQVIGRRVDAAIPVEDSKVSRDHALVDYRNGFFYLVDLGSTNGSFVNGRKVQNAVRLNLGDHVRFGTSSFKVELTKKAQDLSPRTWHDPTNVDLNAFETKRMNTPVANIAKKLNSEGESSALLDVDFCKNEGSSSKIGRVMSDSVPRWLYLVDRNKNQSFKKEQGLMLMILVCSLLVLSAIFVGFDSTPTM